MPFVEFLVTMTTHVPDGTPDEAVDNVRAREASRSRELATEGRLLRLWRPPLQPGEWRTIGLFAADDEDQLEEVLASMPLRVWRTDEVTWLSRHPNDPARPGAGRRRSADNAEDDSAVEVEFLTTLVTVVPAGVGAQTVEATVAEEARRAHELAEQGHLLRLWKLSGESSAMGLWQAKDRREMEAILESLPLYPWMRVETTPLSEHPSDPGRRS
jgi:muconolactone delta-isomerase